MYVGWKLHGPIPTSFQQGRDARLSGCNLASIFIFQRNGRVGVCSWKVALLLYGAVHCLQPLGYAAQSKSFSKNW